MAAMQKLLAPSMSTGSSYGSCWASTANAVAAAAHEQFPAGLRVLVVDDDVTCLKILEHMLQKCRYCVTTCSQAITALSLLRERKDGFDVVISDVHMPDMDGFKLLEHVGLEMDLPVIMMSADGRTSAVMRGIKHGACDYLIKPVRMEELKNVWQHVVRKKWIENKDVEYSGSFAESKHPRRVADESEHASEGTDGSWKNQKKRKESKDDEDDDVGELDNEDPLASKKSRVVWSVELHQQFVNAVYQLGIDKAVPKRILEIMNVPGLTRENVASHLQKFRLYLKRISGVTQYQCGLSTSLCNPLEANDKIGSLGRPDFHSFASAGQIPPQSLAALHAELLGRPSGSIILPAMDQSVILQASNQGSKFLPSKKEVAFGQALFKCQSEISKQLLPSGITAQEMSSSFTSWPSNQLSVTSPTNKLGRVGSIQNNNLLMQMLQQQQQPQDVFHSVVTESHNGISVQPSCLVAPYQSPNSLSFGSDSVSTSLLSILAPSQPSSNIHFGSDPVLSASNSTFNGTAINFDYSVLSSLSNNVSLGMGHVSDGDLKNIGMLSNYSPPDSVSSSVSSSSVCTSSSAGWKLQNSKMNIGSTSGLPAHLPNLCIQGSEVKSGTSINQVQVRNLGFVGKGTCIPSRFAVDDLESPTKHHSYIKTSIFDDVEKVKQEFNLDFLDGSKVGCTMRIGALSKDSSVGYFLKS